MFNVSRSPTANGLHSSFVSTSDPLAASTYSNDDLDPWSAQPTPALAESRPQVESFGVLGKCFVKCFVISSDASGGSLSQHDNLAGEAQIPTIYHQAFNAVDSLGTGFVSVNALQRVLSTSGIPASSIEQIVNLVTSRPKVTKPEFFVAMALVGLAQQGKGQPHTLRLCKPVA